MKKLSILLIILFLGFEINAKDHTVDQKDKQFSMSELVVKVGDIVHFRNSDSFFHNVYSLSPLKIFDLGSYPKGQSKSVTFDKPGEVEVNCAIHPSMKIKIKVEK